MLTVTSLGRCSFTAKKEAAHRMHAVSDLYILKLNLGSLNCKNIYPIACKNF